MDPSIIDHQDSLERNTLSFEQANTAVSASSSGLIASLSLIWDHRRFLLKLTSCGLLLSVVVAFTIPKKYKSTTQIMPPDNQSGAGLAMITAMTAGSSGGLGTIASSLLGMKNTGELFIGVLRSRTVQDHIINKFDLRKVYRVRLYEQARRKLTKETGISQDRKSQIITLTVFDKDPQRAAAIAGEYISELDHLMTELNTSSAHRERLFLEDRLRVVKGELDQSSREFSEFASKHTALDIKDQGKAMMESAASLQGQLIAAESELRGLEEIYTPNNVRIQSIQARIDELKKKQREALGSSTKSDPSNSDLPYPSIRQLPILGVTYADLYRRTKIDEAVYETLTKEYEMARVEEAKEVPTVKVLDDANIPERKASPPRTLIVVLSCFASMVAGIGGIFARKRWNELAVDDERRVFLSHVFSTTTQLPMIRRFGGRDKSADS